MAKWFFTDEAVPVGLWQMEQRGRSRYSVLVEVPGCRFTARCGRALVARDLLEAVAVALYGDEVNDGI